MESNKKQQIEASLYTLVGVCTTEYHLSFEIDPMGVE